MVTLRPSPSPTFSPTPNFVFPLCDAEKLTNPTQAVVIKSLMHLIENVTTIGFQDLVFKPNSSITDIFLTFVRVVTNITAPPNTTPSPIVCPTAKTYLPTPSLPSLVKLNISIISGSFGYKQVAVTSSNSVAFGDRMLSLQNEDCTVTSYKSTLALNLIFLVTNVGNGDLFINESSLVTAKCSLKKAYPQMYKIYVANITKTRSEKCIEDTVTPRHYVCENQTIGMGLSPGNYFVSEQWVDVSNAGLIAGRTYDVYVEVFPFNALLKAVSEPMKILFSVSRKRYLRKGRK